MHATLTQATFAANLRRTLAERRMTQEELARRLPRSNRTVSGWCRAERMPYQRSLDRLEAVLEREPGWFQTEHDS